MEAGDSPVLLPLTLAMSQGREKDDGSTKNHSTSFQEKEPLATSREEFADPKWTESPKSNNTLKDTNLQCRHHQPPPLPPAKGYGQVAVVPTEHPSDTVPHCGTEISGPTRLLNDSTNFPQQFNSDHPTIGNSSNRSRQHHLDHVDSQQQQDDESSSACKDDTGQGTCGPILAGSHDDCDKKDKERNSETSNDKEQGAFVGRRNMDHAPPTKPNEPSPPLGIQSKEERSAIGPPEDKKHDEEKEYPTAVSDKTPLEGTVVPHKLVKSVTRTPRLQRRRSMGSSVSLASMDSQKNSLFQENMSLPSSSSRMAASYQKGRQLSTLRRQANALLRQHELAHRQAWATQARRQKMPEDQGSIRSMPSVSVMRGTNPVPVHARLVEMTRLVNYCHQGGSLHYNLLLVHCKSQNNCLQVQHKHKHNHKYNSDDDLVAWPADDPLAIARYLLKQAIQKWMKRISRNC